MPGARSVRIVVTRLTAPRIVPSTGKHQPEDPQVRAHPGRVQAAVQRCVGEPAEVGSAVRGQEAGDDHRAAEGVHPVRERVQPREGDVRRADLQRDDVVREAERERRREQEHHHGAVDGEELVVLLVRQELQPGRASSARISSAMTPASAKKMNDVTVYITPIVLWLVVVM